MKLLIELLIDQLIMRIISVNKNDSELTAFVSKAEAATYPDPWSEASLVSSLGSGAILLCCEGSGQNIGYIIGSAVADEAEILRLTVLPEFRRRGAGTMLLTAFLNEAEKAGAKKAYLEVRSGNTAARTLYSSLGFIETGIRKNYYIKPREDAVLMCADIPPERISLLGDINADTGNRKLM